MRRAAYLLALGAFAAALGVSQNTRAVGAPAASPAPASTPQLGYAGKGAIVIQTTVGGTKLTVGGDMGFIQSAQMLRVDVLSIKIPGMDPTVGAAASMELFPAGGFTVVLDRANSRYVVWSPSKQRYYVGSFLPNPSASPTPHPTPAPSASAQPSSGPIDFLKKLKDYRVLTVSINLGTRGTTNGHPTTPLNFQLLTEDNQGKKSDVHGTLQSADDLDGLPVQLTASVTGTEGPQGEARIDVTSIDKRATNPGDFAIPKGYTKSNDLFDVIGANLPSLTPGK